MCSGGLFLAGPVRLCPHEWHGQHAMEVPKFVLSPLLEGFAPLTTQWLPLTAQAFSEVQRCCTSNARFNLKPTLALASVGFLSPARLSAPIVRRRLWRQTATPHRSRFGRVQQYRTYTTHLGS